MITGGMTNPSMLPNQDTANSTQMLSFADKANTTASANASTQDPSKKDTVEPVNPNEGNEVAVRTYFADRPLMAEIARCESQFRQFSAPNIPLYGKVTPADIGIFQVNRGFHGKRAETLGYDLSTLIGNMAYSRLLVEEQGYWPWLASMPCWGKSPHATAFKARVEARNLAKAKSAELIDSIPVVTEPITAILAER